MRNSSPDTIDDDDQVNVSFPALSFRVLLATGKVVDLCVVSLSTLTQVHILQINQR
jgi:hypothetical protein